MKSTLPCGIPPTATAYPNSSLILRKSNLTQPYTSIFSRDSLCSTGGDNDTLFVGTVRDTYAFANTQIALQPTAFSIFSNSGGNFQVSRLSANFSGIAAAVPEPASVGLLASLLCRIAIHSFRGKKSWRQSSTTASCTLICELRNAQRARRPRSRSAGVAPAFMRPLKPRRPADY